MTENRKRLWVQIVLAVIGILAIIGVVLAARAEAVTLQWDAPAGTAPVNGYTLYFGTAANKVEFKKTVPAAQLIYTNDVLPFGVQYFFKVKAYNDVGESASSNEVTYTRNPYLPPVDNLPPPALSTGPGAAGSLRVQ